MIGSVDETADAAGNFASTVVAPALMPGRPREQLMVSVNDVTRNEAGAPPDEAVAIGSFILTATDVTVPQWDNRRPTRRSRVTVRAIGFALDAGRPLYAHYLRGGRVLRRQQVGVLRGPCGDLTVQMRQFPAGLRPGRYTIAFNAERRFSRNDFHVSYSVTRLRPR